MSDIKTDSQEFRQQVRMAAEQVAGLRPDELAQALAYEVEPLSGIPAPEAEVRYQPVADADPTVRVYDVVVSRRVRRGKDVRGLDRWLRAALVFAVLVLLAVAGDGVWICVRRSALLKTVGERRPLQAELGRLASETRTVRASAEAIRTRRESVVRAQDRVAAWRAEQASVLGELAAVCGRSAVLRSIAAGKEPHSLHVRAIDVSGEAAASMMQTLSASVRTNGWQLLPGEIVGSGTGETVSFSFQLTRTR